MDTNLLDLVLIGTVSILKKSTILYQKNHQIFKSLSQYSVTPCLKNVRLATRVSCSLLGPDLTVFGFKTRKLTLNFNGNSKMTFKKLF